MAVVKLSYNPFIREMIVKFNGESPKINSQIEKYIDQKLSKWIDVLPKILYDEMNGFDFEIEFEGTIFDMKSVVASFDVSDSVSFNHKYVLEDSNIKYNQIKELLFWLESSTFEVFNYQDFKEEYVNSLDDLFSVILIGIDEIKIPLKTEINLNFERVYAINQMPVDLTSTVVIIKVTSENIDILRQLKLREDVINDQLFVLCEDDKIINKIVDLGYKVEQDLTKMLVEYFENTILTDYISGVLKILRDKFKQISTFYLNKDEMYQQVNGTHLHAIKVCEHSNQLLEGAVLEIEKLEEHVLKDDFDLYKKSLVEEISSWKARKNSISDEKIAIKLSIEYCDFINKQLMKYKAQSIQLANQTISKLIDQCDYQRSKNKIQCEQLIEFNEMPSFSSYALTDDLMFVAFYDFVSEMSGNKIPFLKPQNVSCEIQKIYSLNIWRKEAVTVINDELEGFFEQLRSSLEIASRQVKNYYLALINSKIKENENQISVITNNLSKEDTELQNIKKWIICFEDQLNRIGSK